MDKKNKRTLILRMFSHSGKIFILICLACAIVILSGFSAISGGGNSSSAKLTVYVVNYPLKYFAKRIGGEHIEVVFPAPADVDPAYWNPDVDTISAYQQADLIFLNGAGYAKWVDKVSLPRSKLVNTSKKLLRPGSISTLRPSTPKQSPKRLFAINLNLKKHFNKITRPLKATCQHWIGL
jgi:hypothetical protein